MANTFKNFGDAIVTGGTTLYTCPADTIAVVLHLQAANVDGANSADVSVHWTDDSDSDEVTYLIKEVALGATEAISALTGKLVLEAGDTIVGTASADGDIEVSGSVLEIS